MRLESTAKEIMETIHAHPTLSEAVMEAAADALGVLDLGIVLENQAFERERRLDPRPVEPGHIHALHQATDADPKFVGHQHFADPPRDAPNLTHPGGTASG